jgi:hypothetical protein
VTGDKATRFGAFSAQAEAGNVDILRGDWNESWFTALEAFPEAAHDDDVDFLDLQELQSEAVVNLSQRQKTTGPIGIARLPRHKPQSRTLEIMPHQRRIRRANLHVFAISNVWPAPSARGNSHLALVSLLQRIRSRVSSPAKMETRAARSS